MSSSNLVLRGPDRDSAPWFDGLETSYHRRFNSLPPLEHNALRKRVKYEWSLVEQSIELRDGLLQPSTQGGFNPAPKPGGTDIANTTVFVGGLGPNIELDVLKSVFRPFGVIVNGSTFCIINEVMVTDHDTLQVKIPPGKGCGFVQFKYKANAEDAIVKMQGFDMSGCRLRLSWGKTSCE